MMRSEALADVVLLVRRYRLLSGFAESLADPRQPVTRRTRLSRACSPICGSTLDGLHPADVAHILRALPLDERLFVWDLVRRSVKATSWVETSDAVRESLIASMDAPELVAAAATLDTDETGRAGARSAA